MQIVTDNGSAFVKASKKLVKTYSLFWTPYVTHCIDLIFEDIGKKDIVASVIHDARVVKNFIYNHGWLISQMREVCKGEIVRLGATRFATNHIALDTYYLNPKYQYRDNIGDNSDLLKAVHNVYGQLDIEAAGIANFGNEQLTGRVKKRRHSAVSSAVTGPPFKTPFEDNRSQKFGTQFGSHTMTAVSTAILVQKNASNSAIRKAVTPSADPTADRPARGQFW
ncbi:hypothetical protein Dsin_016525 [Dipteronia sinensis]|uniref:DUF659 domain-containing protein n=1 Tax=Dipteronia sinensis TaxID=43782 RepID=A0AAE0E5Q0_9ROSI|nr:hypothetical protein Dsin_016525 [Dipteronia sinensis]